MFILEVSTINPTGTQPPNNNNRPAIIQGEDIIAEQDQFCLFTDDDEENVFNRPANNNGNGAGNANGNGNANGVNDDVDLNREAHNDNVSNLEVRVLPAPNPAIEPTSRTIRLSLQAGTTLHTAWRGYQAVRAGGSLLTIARGTCTTAGRWAPGLGLAIAAVDIGIDYAVAGQSPRASDVIESMRPELLRLGLTAPQIRRMKELADTDIEALRTYMKDECHVHGPDVDQLIDDPERGLKAIKKARDDAFKDAHSNAALTVGGATIGAIIGTCICPGPGTLVGAAIGAAVGGLVNLGRKLFSWW